MGIPPMGKAPSTAIPHHPRNTYHQRIQPHSTDYYCWEGTWKYYKGKAPQGKVCLVEVWNRAGKIEIHPSRNPFFLARNPQQDWFWHVAMNHFMRTTMLKARNGQVTAQDRKNAMAPPLVLMGTPQGTTGTGLPSGGRRGAAPASPRPRAATAATNTFNKDSTTKVPDWALSYENIIGYTSGSEIEWVGHANQTVLMAKYADQSKVTTIPSVYFFGGHLTTDHGTKENVGFTPDDPGTCLFFGNVLEAYV